MAQAASGRTRLVPAVPGSRRGAQHRLVLVDRVLAMLLHLRRGAPHDVPACWFGVERSTITRAIGEVRLLLATRG